jgi:preprotein translocase subunit SecG
MGDQPVARPLPAHRTKQTRNKRTQTSMPQIGFEPAIPVFERAKTVHALDRATTVIVFLFIYLTKILHAFLNSSVEATWLLQH